MKTEEQLKLLREKSRLHYAKHRNEIILKAREHRRLHPDNTRRSTRKWRLNNLEKSKKIEKIYRENNRDKIRNRKRIYNKRMYHSSIEFRLERNLRTRIKDAFRNKWTRKSARTIELIGCSIEFLKTYLESRFTYGMSWENRSEWHIDHITPCAAFDLSQPSQQRACFNYTNLRPIWKMENLSKGSKIPKQHQLEFL